jgi:hypothetical protein
MKKFRIRFIKNKNCAEKFSIQRLTWYGRWKDIEFKVGSNAGTCWYLYRSNNKQQLLSIVRDEYFKISPLYFEVMEYPMIKLY